MSGGLEALAMKEDDVTKMLAAGSHLGDANVHFQMADYVYKTKSDGTKSLCATCCVYCSSVDV
jgi:small subunit ribosomal protein SAe